MSLETFTGKSFCLLAYLAQRAIVSYCHTNASGVHLTSSVKTWKQIQSTLVISTSVISNNHLSRRENLNIEI